MKTPKEKQRDQYGFMRVIDEEQAAFEEKYKKLKADREMVWSQMIVKSQQELPPRSNSLKKLIRKGVPANIRGLVWLRYSGAEEKMKQSPSIYGRVLEKAMELQYFEDEIDRALTNTFPDNLYFTQQRDSMQSTDSAHSDQPNSILQKLKRVLMAYAMYNPSVGFVTPLNKIVGMFLLFLDNEEQAFWLLVALVQDILPPNYWNAELNMEGLRVDQEVLWSLLHEKHSKIFHKLVSTEENDGRSSLKIITVEWFLKLFVDILPTETYLRIWDCLFYEGNKILFRAALTLLKMHQFEIMRSQAHEDLYNILKSFPLVVYDCERFTKMMFKRLMGPCGYLPKKGIVERRKCTVVNWSFIKSSIKGDATPVDDSGLKKRFSAKPAAGGRTPTMAMPKKLQKMTDFLIEDNATEGASAHSPGRDSFKSFMVWKDLPSNDDEVEQDILPRPRSRRKSRNPNSLRVKTRISSAFVPDTSSPMDYSPSTYGVESIYSLSQSRCNTIALSPVSRKSLYSGARHTFRTSNGDMEFDFVKYYEKELLLESKKRKSRPGTIPLAYRI
ncbi:hypothetical protein MP638_001021 [Amoeboaphelidium occidentale]|nr:hypothetical protein MP638_001021 [Amoeboaphelidium occidentale]